MKKIIILTVMILVLPFMAIGVLLRFSINVFDNPDFWYGYMAFFGTVLLGAIALIQNNKANAINDRILTMQEELQRFQIKEKASPVDVQPVILDQKRESFVVSDDDCGDRFDIVNQQHQYFVFYDCPAINREKSKMFDIVFEVKNISDNVLKEIYIEDLRVYDIITNVSNVSEEKEEIREYLYENNGEYAQCILRPNESLTVCLKIDMDDYDLTEESFHVSFNLSTMSIYNVIFSGNVTLQRNNVVDTKDRMYVKLDRCYFVNMPEAT